MRRVLALTLAVGVSSASLTARPFADGPAPTPALVRIDAVVTDAKGRPVTDLKPGDFTLLEDGAAEKIESVAFVAADGAGRAGNNVDSGDDAGAIASRADENAEAARSGARLFAIFLDEYHVAPGPAADRARDRLLQFVQHDLGPRDLAIVVKPLDSLFTFQLTHDIDALTRVIGTFEGRKGDYTPKGEFEANYVAAAPSRVEQVRSQIVISALNALATHLGVVGPGRKTVLVVSEDFAQPPRLRADPLPTVESAVRIADRQGVSFYALDPRAFDPDAPSPDAQTDDGTAPKRDALRGLVAETDGVAMRTAADAESGMQRLVADASAYYVLAFQPAHPTEFKVLHPVEVRVARANVTMHARKGYWSASADDLLLARTETRAAMPKPPPQPMRHTSPLIHPWFGVERGSGGTGEIDGRVQVSFVWDPVPPVPGDRARTGPPSLVSLKATSGVDGSTVFEGVVRPSTAGASSSPDAPLKVNFDVKPGRLLVQIAIQDADARLLDTDVRDVFVGGLPGPVEVGTPEVFAARSAREYRELDADRSAVPLGTRDFTRDERLLIRVPVYGRDPSIGVTATLASKMGSAMRSLQATPVADTWLYEIDLPLAGLAPGEYSVQIVASGDTGNSHDAVPFRVIP